MEEKSKELSAKKHKAIVALLQKPTIQKAAKSAGIGETTIHRWLADDSFQTVYLQAKRRLVSHAIARIQNASGEAVDVLVEIFRDKDNPPSTRLTAARTVLEMAMKAVGSDEFETGFSEFEKMMGSHRF